MNRPLVVGVGRVGVAITGLTPHLPDGGAAAELAELDVAPGPGVAVAASAAIALGCRARVVGAVGADALGGVVRQLIGRAGIDVEHLRPGGRSPVAVRVVSPQGSQGLLELVAGGAPPALALGPALDDADAVLVDASDVPLAISAAEYARARGIPVVADFGELREGLGELIGLADVVISSERLSAELAPRSDLRDALQALAAMGPRAVVITLGGSGAIGLHGRQIVECPAFPVDVADPTGAGAVFHGAFVAGLLGALPFARCLELAAAAAALSCAGIGAWAGVPTRESVLDLVRTRT